MSDGDAAKNPDTNARSGTQTALIVVIVVLVIGLIAGVVAVIIYIRRPDKEPPDPHPCEMGFTHIQCTPTDLYKYCTDNYADKNIQARCSQHCRQAPTLHNHCEYEAACRDLEYPTPAESVALFANCKLCVPYADKLQFCDIEEFEEVCTADLCGEYCSTIETSDPRFATCVEYCPTTDPLSSKCAEYCSTVDESHQQFATCVEYCERVPSVCIAMCNNKQGYSPLSPALDSMCKLLGPSLLENAIFNITSWFDHQRYAYIAWLTARECIIDFNDSDDTNDIPGNACDRMPVVHTDPDYAWRIADVLYEKFTAPNGVGYDSWLCTIASTNPSCAAAPFLSLGEWDVFMKPLMFVSDGEKIRFRLVSVGGCRYIWTDEKLIYMWGAGTAVHFTEIWNTSGPSDPGWQPVWDELVEKKSLFGLMLAFVE